MSPQNKKTSGKGHSRTLNVEIAKRVLDPMAFLTKDFDFSQFQKLNCKVSYLTPDKMSLDIRDWTVNLLKDNLYDLYAQSAWGWNESSKKKELFHSESRFLIATNESGKNIGYCHFRFDLDYGRSVIYLYEIQVDADNRAKGVGSALLSLIETLGRNAKMELLVLTCFKANAIAQKFFKKHGLTVDKTNPPDEEEKDYVILSKRLQC